MIFINGVSIVLIVFHTCSDIHGYRFRKVQGIARSVTPCKFSLIHENAMLLATKSPSEGTFL